MIERVSRTALRLFDRLKRRGSQAAGTTDTSPEPAVEQESRPAPVPEITSWLLGLSWEPAAAGEVRRLRIEGAAWRADGKGRGSRVVAVTLTSGDASIEATIEQLKSAAYNDLSESPDRDRRSAGFVAVLDPAMLTEHEGPGIFTRQWQVLLTVHDADGPVSGRLLYRQERTSAGQLHSNDAGSGCLILPSWEDSDGLLLTVARRALVAESISFRGDELVATIDCRGDITPTTARLRRDRDLVPLELSARADGRYDVRGSIASLPDRAPSADASSWYLVLADKHRETRMVHWQGPQPHGFREVCATDPRIAIRFGPKGVIRIDVHRRRLAVDRVTVQDTAEPQLVIAGEFHGVSGAAVDWVLSGGRRQLQPDRLELDDGRFTASYPLLAIPEWGRSRTALPTGDYRLAVRHRGGTTPALLDQELAETLITTTAIELATIDLGTDHGKLLVRIAAPITPGERSRYRHRRFEIRHKRDDVEPTDTIFLDSFDGKNAGDNTRAVADELARRRPDLRPVWTVADRSVEVPDGAEAVIFKTDRWWRALASSRYVVTNCWMPGKFLRRDHQTVLQTWHGTPLKLLGFDRIGTKRGDAYRRRTVGEVAQWSLLIAQNPYSSKVFRSAYGYDGKVLEIGYPRNDVLSLAGDADRRRIRDRLGIGADEKVVLYAPTWRENAKGLFRELDFDAVGAALGRTGRLLIRGHANTIRHGAGVRGGRLLDVTLYPDLAELYLISDVMITDYSSTMFDFSVTGKPMIFFAPDLDHYSGKLRGTYFDLAEVAPGPLLTTTAAVIDALGDLDQLRTDHAAAYAHWRQEFNPYDDGHASQRAVDALLGEDSSGELPTRTQ